MTPTDTCATDTRRPAWLVPWLALVAASVLVMIVLGGVVRLAHAGLSIVDWRPITGVLPPLSEADWGAVFDAYRQSPEYLLINSGMTLADFRQIYWLEYLHRVLGRLAGLVLMVPLAIGLIRRSFDRPTAAALLGIALLFAMQGIMGWLMVASGLHDQPWVSPYRLALHLWLALALLAAVVWLLLTHTVGAPRVAGGQSLRLPVLVALVAAVVQAGAGALVAALKAGWASDTFPRMQGQWLPDEVAAHGLTGVASHPAVAHFTHRWFAFVVLAAVLWLHARARTHAVAGISRQLATTAAALTVVQVALGISVVLASVPAWLASLHQAVGALLVGTLVAVLHQARGPTATGA